MASAVSSLSPVEQLYDVVEQEISILDVQQRNLQQLCNVVMSMFAAPC